MAIVQQDMQKTSLAGEGAHAGREQDGGTRGSLPPWSCLASRSHPLPLVTFMLETQCHVLISLPSDITSWLLEMS